MDSQTNWRVLADKRSEGGGAGSADGTASTELWVGAVPPTCPAFIPEQLPKHCQPSTPKDKHFYSKIEFNI
jgi:hypothetical protein